MLRSRNTTHYCRFGGRNSVQIDSNVGVLRFSLPPILQFLVVFPAQTCVSTSLELQNHYSQTVLVGQFRAYGVFKKVWANFVGTLKKLSFQCIFAFLMDPAVPAAVFGTSEVAHNSELRSAVHSYLKYSLKILW